MDKTSIITDREVLKKVSDNTTLEEVTELNLANRLREASKRSWTNGCGVAAVQLGVHKRFAWIKIGDRESTLLNPEITLKMGNYLHKEGCLSLPGQHYFVERFFEIEYMSHGKKKRAKGFKAAVIQHEVDHMDGILIDERGVDDVGGDRK